MKSNFDNLEDWFKHLERNKLIDKKLPFLEKAEIANIKDRLYKIDNQEEMLVFLADSYPGVCLIAHQALGQID